MAVSVSRCRWTLPSFRIELHTEKLLGMEVSRVNWRRGESGDDERFERKGRVFNLLCLSVFPVSFFFFFPSPLTCSDKKKIPLTCKSGIDLKLPEKSH